LCGPVDLVFGPNGDLFVSSCGTSSNAALEYDGTTGAFVQTFASGGGLDGPSYLTFGPSSPAAPEPPALMLAVLATLTGLAIAALRRAAAWFRPAKP